MALLAGALAACTGAPPAEAPPTGPVEIRFERPGGVLARRVERLAAECWLDRELGGGVLTVDRRAGRLEASTEAGVVLIATVADAGGGAERVRLEGPALAEPDRRARMASALARVLEGPGPRC